MSVRPIPALALLGLLLALSGCSQDDPTIAPIDVAPDVVSDLLLPAGADFAIEIKAAGSAADPITGPFVLFGDSLRYVPELGALAVDLSVANQSRASFPLPVGMTFTRLFPADVRVLDADNGIEGPGAAIVFEFANDDLYWTPGERSLPRTVHFAVDQGLAVAFHARLDLVTGPRPGTIGGRVWHDADADGVADPDEAGVPGVPVYLFDPDNPFEDNGGVRENLRFAISGRDGRYAFGDLDPGLYTVEVVPGPGQQPTTPTAVHVLLVMADGQVSSFLDADFGLSVEGGDVMALEASADATVRADVEARANDNYGCDPVIAVGNGRDGSPDLIRGLVRFDLPVFIRPVELVRARLVGHIDRFRDGYGQIYTLAVNAVVPSDSLPRPGDPLGAWIEGDGAEQLDGSSGCVWVDPAYGVAWVGAGDGGDDNNQTQPPFRPEPAAIARVIQDSMGPAAIVEWDVTDLVRAWFDGSAPNLGVFIRDIPGPETPPELATFRSLWFVSREGEAAGRGRGMRLLLEFVNVPVGTD